MYMVITSCNCPSNIQNPGAAVLRPACSRLFHDPGKKCRALPPARWDLAVAAKKQKGRALLLHTAAPKFLQEFLPEFRSSLDVCKKIWCCAPQCRPPKARAAGPLDKYIVEKYARRRNGLVGGCIRRKPDMFRCFGTWMHVLH